MRGGAMLEDLGDELSQGSTGVHGLGVAGY
jgi:hypothetical protein